MPDFIQAMVTRGQCDHLLQYSFRNNLGLGTLMTALYNRYHLVNGLTLPEPEPTPRLTRQELLRERATRTPIFTRIPPTLDLHADSEDDPQGFGGHN